MGRFLMVAATPTAVTAVIAAAAATTTAAATASSAAGAAATTTIVAAGRSAAAIAATPSAATAAPASARASGIGRRGNHSRGRSGRSVGAVEKYLAGERVDVDRADIEQHFVRHASSKIDQPGVLLQFPVGRQP
jgi:hypothetical protein